MGGTREKWGHIKKISAGALRRHCAHHLQIASDATDWRNRNGTYAKLASIITERVHKLLVQWQNIGGNITYRVPKQIIGGHVPCLPDFGASGIKDL